MHRQINIATKDGYETVLAEIMLLTLGEKRHRFAVHDDILSDYRSGYRVTTLRAVKIERMARISSYTRTTNRQAAQITLDRIVQRVGLDKVLSTLAAPPSLNTVKRNA